MDDLVADAEAARDLRAERGVRALHLAVHGLAEVVQQPAEAHRLHVRADLVRDRDREPGGLDGVAQLVLAVGVAETQLAERLRNLRVERRNLGIKERLLAGLGHHPVHLAARLLDGFLDAAGLDAPVLHEACERYAGDLAPHGVEADDRDDLGRVVDQQVAAGRGLEGADVAALAPDDAALQFVGGDRDDGDRRLRGDLGGHALHHGGEDLASPRIGLGLGGGLHRAHPPRGLVAQLSVEAVEQQIARLLGAQSRDPLKLAAEDGLLLAHSLLFLMEARLSGFEFLLAAVQTVGAVANGLLAALEALGAAFQRLLALLEAALDAGGLAPLLAQFLVGLLAVAEAGLLCLKLQFAATVLRLLADAVGGLLGAAPQVARAEAEDGVGDGEADHESGHAHKGAEDE